MTNDELETMLNPEAIRVADGFRAYPPDGDTTRGRWTLTGCLPDDGPLGNVSHYDMEEAIIKAGMIDRSDCDSESGQFFVYPSSEAQCRQIGAWIQERLTREIDPLA